MLNISCINIIDGINFEVRDIWNFFRINDEVVLFDELIEVSKIKVDVWVFEWCNDGFLNGWINY